MQTHFFYVSFHFPQSKSRLRRDWRPANNSFSLSAEIFFIGDAKVELAHIAPDVAIKGKAEVEEEPGSRLSNTFRGDCIKG